MSELVFISVFNYGGIELAKNHIESLKRNNITNYMAYVTDDESYKELNLLNYNVAKYDSDNDKVNKEKNDFGSNTFNDMSYIRYNVINSLLIKGNAVWYCDVDTVVLYNLNDFYENLNKDFDICFQDDINMLCTGCMLFLPNEKTIHITEMMYLRKNIEYNDQVFLNNILFKDIGIEFKIDVLNETQFPNGLLYFNDLKTEYYFRKAQVKFNQSDSPIYFVHANYMVGIDTKIEALKSKNLWFV